jgi:hypothetical protein
MHASKIATSTAARRFDCSDVDLFHLHHRIERARAHRVTYGALMASEKPEAGPGTQISPGPVI